MKKPGAMAALASIAVACIALASCVSHSPGQPDSRTVVDPIECTRSLQKFASEVSIRVQAANSSITLARLRDGISVPVEIVVPPGAASLQAAPLDFDRCARPDANGLTLFPVVQRGATTVYCPACDLGYCKHESKSPTVPIKPGKHSYKFVWRGQAGSGPSHYPTPAKQTQVGPGSYVFSVRVGLSSKESACAFTTEVASAPYTIQVLADSTTIPNTIPSHKGE